MSDPETNPPTRLWDRGLFWFGLFGMMAVVGVLVIAPKYSIRRSKMDLNYKGRELSYEVRLKQRDEFLAANPIELRPRLPWLNLTLALLGIPATALFWCVAANLYLYLTGRTEGFFGPPREPTRRP